MSNRALKDYKERKSPCTRKTKTCFKELLKISSVHTTSGKNKTNSIK